MLAAGGAAHNPSSTRRVFLLLRFPRKILMENLSTLKNYIVKESA
jgi:hypothetical protein